MTPRQDDHGVPSWAEIDEIVYIHDRARRRDAIEEMLAQLRRLSAVAPTSELYCKLGYVTYHHPDRAFSGHLQALTESALSSVSPEDEDFPVATLYLGHHAFDMGDFGKASKYFDRVDVSDFDDFLRLKVQEVRLACSIRLRGIDASISELDSYVASCRRIEPTAVLPLNLYATMRAVVSVGAMPEEARSALLRIDDAAQFGWFGELLTEAEAMRSAASPPREKGS